MKNEKSKGKTEGIILIAALLVAGIIVPLTGGTTSPLLYLCAILFPTLWVLKYKKPKELYITSENLGKSVLWGILVGSGLTLVRIAIASSISSTTRIRAYAYSACC